MSGLIKLHRKTLDNPVVCKDSDHLAVWMYLLLNATHKEIQMVFKGKKTMLQPGQLITGRKSIAEKLRVHESKVQRVLTCFENEHQIEQLRGNNNRLITVLNWHDYQDNEQLNEHQMNNYRTTDEQLMNTNNNLRSKELKNEKKKEYTFSVYTSNPELVSTLKSFEEFRKKIKKPLTDKAKDLLLQNLDKLASTDQDKISVLEQSIFNGWQGVFALKNKKGGNQVAVNGGSYQENISGIDFGF